MFDHFKCLKDWTIFACHMYERKYCKVLTIAYCDMQCEDGPTQTLFWENLNFVMAENGVSNVNFKGFMANNTHANWIAVRKIYGEGDPTLPMMGGEHICPYHWS